MHGTYAHDRSWLLEAWYTTCRRLRSQALVYSRALRSLKRLQSTRPGVAGQNRGRRDSDHEPAINLEPQLLQAPTFSSEQPFESLAKEINRSHAPVCRLAAMLGLQESA